jgi:hypothetical protein
VTEGGITDPTEKKPVKTVRIAGKSAIEKDRDDEEE